MRKTSTGKQSGFILSMEAILIMTILGIGLLVGIVAVRDALFKKALSRQDQNFYVFDSSDPTIVIGKAASFDEHEAPLVPFVDYGPRNNADGDPINFRILIGVRDDRFTTRQPVFYTDAACSANPCIAGPSTEAAYNSGIDNIPGTGAVSYLDALQGITYGIGAGLGGDLKGRLFRQTTAACAGLVRTYVWDSQRVVPGSPCVLAPSVPLLGGLFEAEQVLRGDGSGDNVLDPLTPPFFTNLVGTPNTYTSVPATGEGL